jgi:hypothetical protein
VEETVKVTIVTPGPRRRAGLVPPLTAGQCSESVLSQWPYAAGCQSVTAPPLSHRYCHGVCRRSRSGRDLNLIMAEASRARSRFTGKARNFKWNTDHRPGALGVDRQENRGDGEMCGGWTRTLFCELGRPKPLAHSFSRCTKGSV